MRVFLTELDTVTKQEISRLYQTLPPFRKQSAERLSDTNFSQHVLGFCLVRYALKALDSHADTEHWHIADGGKPSLKKSDLHFNLSHTAHAVAVAVSTEEEIGIDIERIVPRKVGFAERYFSKEEQQLVEQASDPVCELIRIWTAKEAVGKRCGTGLSCSIPDISTKDVQSLLLSPGGVPHWLSLCPASSFSNVEYITAQQLLQAAR